ncbi:MAG: hypothetical protein AB7K52_00045 [Phycisphaerales bacterium]
MSATHDTLVRTLAAQNAHSSPRTPSANTPRTHLLELTWPVHRRGVLDRLVWRIMIDIAPDDSASLRVRSWADSTGIAPEGPTSARGPGTLELVGPDLWHLSIPSILSAIIRRPPGGPAALLYAHAPVLADPSIPEGGIEQPRLEWNEA